MKYIIVEKKYDEQSNLLTDSSIVFSSKDYDECANEWLRMVEEGLGNEYTEFHLQQINP
jgi:hypothetical protein